MEPGERRVGALVGSTMPLLAVGVRDALTRGGIAWRAEVTEPRDLVARVGREHPDLCLLIAPYVPHLTEVIAQLCATSRSTRTVVLAADERPAKEVLDALRAGASGWLPLSTDDERLVDALRAVTRGEAAVPRALLARVLTELRGGDTREVLLPDGTLLMLPPREYDVLEGLARGLDTAEVSRRLGIEPATTRGYVRSAVERLGVADRRAAVQLVQGLLPKS